MKHLGISREVRSIFAIVFVTLAILGASTVLAYAQDAKDDATTETPRPVNVCTLIGNLTKDVYVNEKGTFAAVRLAVNNYAGKGEDDKPIYKAMFIDVVFFGDNVEKVKDLKKGDRIEISGRLELKEKPKAAGDDDSDTDVAAKTPERKGDSHRIVARSFTIIRRKADGPSKTKPATKAKAPAKP